MVEEIKKVQEKPAVEPSATVTETYRLNWLERDALREITSIGAGNATTALSELINKRIDVAIPRLNLVHIQTIPEIMGGPEEVATAVHMEITGDTTGSMVILFDKKSSLVIADILQGREAGTTTELSPEDNKKLGEMGDTLAKACLKALSDFLGLNLGHHQPGVACDMVKALMDTVLIQFAQRADYALLLEVEFDAPPTKVKGNFFLIFDVKTLDAILKSIRKRLGEKTFKDAVKG